MGCLETRVSHPWKPGSATLRANGNRKNEVESDGRIPVGCASAWLDFVFAVVCTGPQALRVFLCRLLPGCGRALSVRGAAPPCFRGCREIEQPEWTTAQRAEKDQSF